MSCLRFCVYVFVEGNEDVWFFPVCMLWSLVWCEGWVVWVGVGWLWVDLPRYVGVGPNLVLCVRLGRTLLAAVFCKCFLVMLRLLRVFVWDIVCVGALCECRMSLYWCKLYSKIKCRC